MRQKLLVIAILMIFSRQGNSEEAVGFFDLLGGIATSHPQSQGSVSGSWSGLDSLGNPYSGSIYQPFSSPYNNSSSGVGGMRAGVLHKHAHYSLGWDIGFLDYNEFGTGYTLNTANSPILSASPGQEGVNIFQPAFDVVAGIPLKIFRFYGGAGLTLPLISEIGGHSSLTTGYETFFGARVLITNDFNVFVENRISDIFTHSFQFSNNNYNDNCNYGYACGSSSESYTAQGTTSATVANLRSNMILFGLGWEF